MFFYRQTENGEITGYQESETQLIGETLEPITQEEYETVLKELAKKEEETIAAAEQSKDEKIAELEQENAALLYQLLTGEEYAGV